MNKQQNHKIDDEAADYTSNGDDSPFNYTQRKKNSGLTCYFCGAEEGPSGGKEKWQS